MRCTAGANESLSSVGLDGGWRVYSSGAGIALSLIVRRFLGLNLESDALSLDPVIPPTLNGLRVDLELFGKPVEIVYEVRGRGCGVTTVEIDGKDLAFGREINPYRTGAARVPLAQLRSALSAKQSVLRVAVG